MQCTTGIAFSVESLHFSTPNQAGGLTHCAAAVPACTYLPTEIQAFDGLGPEVINSRLAMLGFAVAAFWELTQGIDIFQQVHKYPLLTIATFVIFTAASWIPFMQGQSYNVKSGPFTPAVSTD
jgi:hypothetical protein